MCDKNNIGLIYFRPGRSKLLWLFSILNNDDCHNHRYFWETCDWGHFLWVILQHFLELPRSICEYLCISACTVCLPQCMLGHTPPCGQNSWHTLVKTLLFRNYVANGINFQHIIQRYLSFTCKLDLHHVTFPTKCNLSLKTFYGTRTTFNNKISQDSHFIPLEQHGGLRLCL